MSEIYWTSCPQVFTPCEVLYRVERSKAPHPHKTNLFAQPADVCLVIVGKHLVAQDGVCDLGRAAHQVDLQHPRLQVSFLLKDDKTAQTDRMSIGRGEDCASYLII